MKFSSSERFNTLSDLKKTRLLKVLSDFHCFLFRSLYARAILQVVLLTGGRVKIGYEVGLKLLRAGATLVVTSRFPRDTAQRYAQPHDASSWQVGLIVTS